MACECANYDNLPIGCKTGASINITSLDELYSSTIITAKGSIITLIVHFPLTINAYEMTRATRKPAPDEFHANLDDCKVWSTLLSLDESSDCDAGTRLAGINIWVGIGHIIEVGERDVDGARFNIGEAKILKQDVIYWRGNAGIVIDDAIDIKYICFLVEDRTLMRMTKIFFYVLIKIHLPIMMIICLFCCAHTRFISL